MGVFDYVRDHYGVPAKRGMRVAMGDREGTITSADHYVHVRFDGQKHSVPVHPLDLTYQPAAQQREGER